MFKISIVEAHGRRRLVLEGKLVSPWTAEVESAWQKAGDETQHRKPVVDLTNVTLISRDGEDTLLKLMREGARFSCGDVLTKHVLKQVARRCRCQKEDQKAGQTAGQKTEKPGDNAGEQAPGGRFPASSNDD